MDFFLQNYKEEEIILIPDEYKNTNFVSFYNTLQIFVKNGLNFEIGNNKYIYNNKVLFCVGGNYLFENGTLHKEFLTNNMIDNHIVYLPSTIKGGEELLKSLKENIIIMCREKKTYVHVKEYVRYKKNIYLHNDLIMNIKGIEKYKDEEIVQKYGNFFNDKSSDFYKNFLLTLNKKDMLDVDGITLSTHNLLSLISKNEIIETDDVNVAIISSLLNKKVKLYENSNFCENENIYNYSLKELDSINFVSPKTFKTTIILLCENFNSISINLMKIRGPLVILCDEKFEPIFWSLRKIYNLEHLTQIETIHNTDNLSVINKISNTMVSDRFETGHYCFLNDKISIDNNILEKIYFDPKNKITVGFRDYWGNDIGPNNIPEDIFSTNFFTFEYNLGIYFFRNCLSVNKQFLFVKKLEDVFTLIFLIMIEKQINLFNFYIYEEIEMSIASYYESDTSYSKKVLKRIEEENPIFFTKINTKITSDIFFHFNEKNTFCINLDKCVDRWERMNKRFEYFDMKVTRWSASTPENLVDEIILVDKTQGGGAKACAQSHILIWRHVVENNIPYAFILEDDACFDKDWIEKLSKFHFVNFDLIMLNSYMDSFPVGKWNTCQNQLLTGGYIISSSGCKKLFEIYKNKPFTTSDIMLCELQRYNKSYVYFPWLIIQENNESLIGNNVDFDRELVKKYLNNVGYDIENYI